SNTGTFSLSVTTSKKYRVTRLPISSSDGVATRALSAETIPILFRSHWRRQFERKLPMLSNIGFSTRTDASLGFWIKDRPSSKNRGRPSVCMASFSTPRFVRLPRRLFEMPSRVRSRHRTMSDERLAWTYTIEPVHCSVRFYDSFTLYG